MSAVRAVTIRCDRHPCSDEYVSDRRDETDARADAHIFGWVTTGDHDYCERDKPEGAQ